MHSKFYKESDNFLSNFGNSYDSLEGVMSSVEWLCSVDQASCSSSEFVTSELGEEDLSQNFNDETDAQYVDSRLESLPPVREATLSM